jgi:hypothetical protein
MSAVRSWLLSIPSSLRRRLGGRNAAGPADGSRWHAGGSLPSCPQSFGLTPGSGLMACDAVIYEASPDFVWAVEKDSLGIRLRIRYRVIRD